MSKGKINARIKELRKELEEMIGEWEVDGSTPPNYRRRTGLDTEVARVDRWMGGYQDTHKPVVVGWIAKCGNRSNSGVILVTDPSDKDHVNHAIEKAKKQADEALKSLRADIKRF